MKKIYSKAECVAVWLGAGDEDVKRSIRNIQTIVKRYSDSSIEAIAQTGVLSMHKPLDGPRSIIMDDVLFKQPWFSRTWVLQEVFNAKSIHIHYDEYILPWSVVLQVNECVNKSMRGPGPKRQAVMPYIFAELLDPTRYLSTNANNTGLSPTSGILDVLIKAMDLDATDPRDKIFALLQFGSETREVDAIPEIRPDYRKSIKQVFAEFTKWWIISHQSLRILSAVHISVGRTWQKLSRNQVERYREERPSWSYWHDGRSNWARSSLGLYSGDLYSATGNSVPEISLLQENSDSSILKLKGRKLGVIGQIKPYPYFDGSIKDIELDNVYDSIFDPLSRYGIWTAASPHTPKQSRIRTHRGLELPEVLDEEGMRFKRDHYFTHQRCSAHPITTLECHSDCFFTTRSGLKGLCPAPARTEDIIVVLFGGKVPYILREKLELNTRVMRYEFVGECFLQGYMDGRAMREQDESGLGTEVFELI